VTRDELGAWVDGYVRAWRTPGTAPLRELFAEDAVYSPGPFERPHRGLDAIARFWDAERLGPDEEFTFDSELVAVEGRTGVVRADVAYGGPPQRWANLWIVRFDENGRCVDFEEWPISPRP
jgi:SnoaL-like domain